MAKKKTTKKINKKNAAKKIKSTPKKTKKSNIKKSLNTTPKEIQEKKENKTKVLATNITPEKATTIPIKKNTEPQKTETLNWAWVGIFIMSLIATLGSLYFSNFGDPIANIKSGELFISANGFRPCNLCWFARILMYPIVIISFIGILTKDKNFIKYVLGLTIPGIALELYHYALQKLPIDSVIPCSSGNPCSAMQVNYLGFITIPFLCLTAFLIILTFCIISLKKTQK